MPELLDEVYKYWAGWFGMAPEYKNIHLRQPGKGGYYPPFSETPGYTGQKDPKEYFHFRTSHAPMHAHTAELFNELYLNARGWLLDRDLLRGIKLEPHDCVLRILHYLPTPDGLVGEAHRDFDLLTVSVPGTVPGLEVFVPDLIFGGFWAPQEEGVQVGEMLEIATAGKYEATTHRVVTSPNTERYKAVFFALPPNSFELRKGYTAGDYLKEALAKAGTIDIGATP